MVADTPIYKYPRVRGRNTDEDHQKSNSSTGSTNLWRNKIPFLRRPQTANTATSNPQSTQEQSGLTSRILPESKRQSTRLEPPSSPSGSRSQDQSIDALMVTAPDVKENENQLFVCGNTHSKQSEPSTKMSSLDGEVTSNERQVNPTISNNVKFKEVGNDDFSRDSTNVSVAHTPSEDTHSFRQNRRTSFSSHERRTRSRSLQPKSPTKTKKITSTIADTDCIQTVSKYPIDSKSERTSPDIAPATSDHDRFRRLLGEAFRKLWSEVSYKKEMKGIVDMIKNDSKLCKYRYTVVHRLPPGSVDEKPIPVQLFPIHILCAIGATPFIIRKAWRAYPQAVTLPSEPNSIIGSALHYACLFHTHQQKQEGNAKELTSYLEVVQFLVTKNPALLVCSNNKDRRTPLHYACLCSTPRPVKPKELHIARLSHRLENNPKIDSQDADGTSSTCSTGSGSCNSADQLQPLTCTALRVSQHPNDIERIKCKDAVSLTMNANGNEVLAFLTTMFPRAVTKVDEFGYTPLHLACLSKRPSLDVIEHMIRLSPGSCIQQGKDGTTPLHIVMSHTVHDDEKFHLIVKIIKSLIRTKDGEKALSMKDNRGYIPLHVCVDRSNPTVYQLKLLKFLVKKYPDGLNSKDSNNHTPRVLASNKRLDAECVRLLSPFV